MPDLPDLTPAELTAFAQQFGLEPSLTRLPSVGIVNRVYRARRAGQNVVLRVPMPGDEEDTLTESVAVPAAVRAGVRTPELLVFDDSRAVLDAPVTVYAFAAGRSLDGLDWGYGDPRLSRAWREAGRALAYLHAGVQEVPDPHGRLEVIRPPDPARTRQRVLEAGRLSVTETIWATDLTARLLSENPPPARPAFLHNDLHAGNLMVLPDGSLGALIDWGDAGWGDPVLDLSYSGPLAAPDLLAGYEEVTVLGVGGRLRLLACLLDNATRYLTRQPEAHEDSELWYTRPATALMQLLRVSPRVPEWQEALVGRR
ncbi:phosphotransferase family protein [Deinococcus aquaticus]|uniref:Aminoglycoside phosphotransferase family protein n=1 Tax=Deinococcus aquaticus TaxID=328692 RepID=A0ABY7V1I6_9DEIO|nr:aminoglycoside phosphotransferase family protein [Deinococcus aquaticus]WDA59053.1 aminoglycoside phosphotransferase family protein [Deinococcus aquaticus]